MLDEELIAAVSQICNGQEEGFNTLYKRTYQCVYFRSKQLLSKEEDIQDLIQDVYIEVYRSIGTLNNVNFLYPWLKQITFHMATKMYRKRIDTLLNEEDQTVFEMIETDDIATLPELTSDMKATSQIISELIDELPVFQKTALIAYYFDEFNVNKIAEMMECSIGTIKSRLNYARQALKAKVLEKEKRDGILLRSIDFTIVYWAIKYLEENTYLADISAQNIYQNVCASVGLKLALDGSTLQMSSTLTKVQAINQSATVIKAGVKGASLFTKIAAMGTGAKAFSLISAVLITSTVALGSKMVINNLEDAKAKQKVEVETVQTNENGKNETVATAKVPNSSQTLQETPYSRMIKFNLDNECTIYYPTEWGSSAGSKNYKVYFYDDGTNYITFDNDNFTADNIIVFSKDLEMGSYSYYEMETDTGQKIYVTENVYPDHIDSTAYVVDPENKKQYELNAVMKNDFYNDHRELFKKMAKSMNIIAEGYVNYNEAKPVEEPGNNTVQNEVPDVSEVLKAYYEFLICPIIYLDEFISAEKFSLLDVNHDGIPELLLDDVENFGMAIEQILYTYYNGKVIPIGNYGHGSFQLYESGDLFSAVSVAQGYITQNIYEINGDMMVEVASVYSNAGAVTGDPTIKYYISEQLVGKATFEAFMKEHIGDSSLEGEDIKGVYTLGAESIARAISDYPIQD